MTLCENSLTLKDIPYQSLTNDIFGHKGGKHIFRSAERCNGCREVQHHNTKHIREGTCNYLLNKILKKSEIWHVIRG